MLGPFELHVPGRHNVLNATAAVAIGVQLGVAPETDCARGCASFRGVDRRFQVRGKARGVTVVDDYGHHPTEILATLEAARECGYGRVLVCFSRIGIRGRGTCMEEFAGRLRMRIRCMVLPIYAASEEPIAGVTREALAEAIRRTATVGRGVEYARVDGGGAWRRWRGRLGRGT